MDCILTAISYTQQHMWHFKVSIFSPFLISSPLHECMHCSPVGADLRAALVANCLRGARYIEYIVNTE